MKHYEMSLQFKVHILILVISALIIAAPAYSENTFKLKPGAGSAICIECHETIQETLKRPYVHSPIKKGECNGCHNPHTSPFGKLLNNDINVLCSECHKNIIPEKSRSIHAVVIEGNCVSCHDSHASDNQFILVKKGNELCFECHKDVADFMEKAVFKHEPMEKKKGCLNCHNPHASADAPFLLIKESTVLCKECHRTDEKRFADRHMNYPVANSQCTSCHNPHGSGNRGIIFDGVHTPVAKKECDKCHEGPSSSTPLKVIKDGIELCRSCHSEMINEIYSKAHLHWPLVDNTGCLHCHSPHASRQKMLLKGSIVNLCGECHSDTVRLQEISINNPENTKLCKPVKERDCISCHAPHSSDGPLLATGKSFSFETCDKCHDWQTHSTHPIGEKVIDTRNKNLIVDCLSCHLACGTGNKPAMMPYESTYVLCVQCHESYKR